MLKTFNIGKHKINNGRTFVVAEISANHNSNINTAKKLIFEAKKAGADAVKIQSYIPESITINCKKKDFVIKDKNWGKFKNLYNLYKFGQTPIEWHKKLFDYAKKIKIDIFSSPFDENFVDILEELNCIAYKIASPEINHFPLLKKVAKTGKPVIISTGVAFIKDIDNAIKILKKNGCKKIVILKCDTNYPSSFQNSNFSSIKYLKKKYKLPIGFSDHTIGNEAPLISVMFGSCLIEKHFNINNNKALDSFFSTSSKKFKELIKEIRFIEVQSKILKYQLSKQSIKNRKIMRSIYISKNVKKNQIITNENIKIVRPNFGMNTKEYNKVLGKSFKGSYKKGDRLTTQKIK